MDMSNWPITKLFLHTNVMQVDNNMRYILEDRLDWKWLAACLIRYTCRKWAACWKSISLIFHISSLTWFFFQIFLLSVFCHFPISHSSFRRNSHTCTQVLSIEVTINRFDRSSRYVVTSSTMSPLICNFTLLLYTTRRKIPSNERKLIHLIWWWCSC